MQTQDIISVNVWQILISLCNLAILFLILKKFLYQPVKKALARRQADLDAQYAKADEAQTGAEQLEQQWQDKMAHAETEADAIRTRAADEAQRRSDALIAQTKADAERILRQAETDADLERKKAEADIRRQIVDVSTALSEQVLQREINADDHRNLIDSFLEHIGDGDDGNQ